jgi:predicted type IV restriction endonuclease
MAAPAVVRQLVERFQAQIESYRAGTYNETQLRREFLDPFFEALGWDVFNRKGYAEAYKEVIHEDTIRIGGRTKAPDYCFRAGSGIRSLFVEAKKPSVDIRDAASPAYQLRRYAWSAKLSVSILTDFEELAVYDCRKRPEKNDKATTDRILIFDYTQYLDRWDELFDLFSPEAIRRGSLDKLVASKKIKKGTAEVDAAFLVEIESWRDVLARNIALRNAGISTRDLNFAVQRTIDRIVFLRICEDRGIEPYGNLQGMTNGENVYARLGEWFRRADQRYNSGLFYFEGERDRGEPPDEMTLGLAIDDKPLRDIIRNLYFPDSPYEFSVLPAEILGQVYEQFLGKVIRLTPGGQAKVEEKPEVRKAGGVYYTPAYIVDYIVKNTAGKLLGPPFPPGEGRDEGGLTPKQAAGLRIVDPACGSGSFLIGAYQYLLDWHRDRYVADDPEKNARGRNPVLYRSVKGLWKLTTAERKRILLDNIFGVDIDPQAVEVTKLSLLLKVLEGESEETLANQLRLFHERALPDLARNIKCGNSLIGPDYYNGHQLNMLDEEERCRVNVFDWKAEFPVVFKAGGFDAVIGNPPYVSIQTMNERGPEEVTYFNSRYASAGVGNYDIYVVFVERGLSILNARGRLGFILPSKFFATDYGRPLRGLLSRSRALAAIADFRHEQVFAQATTYTCLLFLSRSPCDALKYAVCSPPQIIQEGPPCGFSVDSSTITDAPWTFVPKDSHDLIEKIRNQGTPLLDLPSRISRGSSTGDDDVFVLRSVPGGFATRNGDAVDVEESSLRIPLFATDFGRYCFSPNSGERVIFPYRLDGRKSRQMKESELADRFPKAYSYLKSRKRELLRRKQYKSWFGFSAPRNLDAHDSASLMVPLLANVGSYCALPPDMKRYCPMASGGFTISVPAQAGIDPSYLLGVLNSRLLFWNLERISNIFRGGWITCTKQYVGTLPICLPENRDKRWRARHDRIVKLVEMIQSLFQKLSKARTADDKTLIQRQIDATDRQIDCLVYEHYGLTEAEIAVVEEAT